MINFELTFADDLRCGWRFMVTAYACAIVPALLVEEIVFSSLNCLGQFGYMEPKGPLGTWLQALSGPGAQLTLPSCVTVTGQPSCRIGGGVGVSVAPFVDAQSHKGCALDVLAHERDHTPTCAQICTPVHLHAHPPHTHRADCLPCTEPCWGDHRARSGQGHFAKSLHFTRFTHS